MSVPPAVFVPVLKEGGKKHTWVSDLICNEMLKKMSHINKNESFCHHSCTLHPYHTMPNASIFLSYKLHACVWDYESKLCCLHHINNIFCVPFTYFINESFFLPLCFPFLCQDTTHTQAKSTLFHSLEWSQMNIMLSDFSLVFLDMFSYFIFLGHFKAQHNVMRYT